MERRGTCQNRSKTWLGLVRDKLRSIAIRTGLIEYKLWSIVTGVGLIAEKLRSIVIGAGVIQYKLWSFMDEIELIEDKIRLMWISFIRHEIFVRRKMAVDQVIAYDQFVIIFIRRGLPYSRYNSQGYEAIQNVTTNPIPESYKQRSSTP